MSHDTLLDIVKYREGIVLRRSSVLTLLRSTGPCSERDPRTCMSTYVRLMTDSVMPLMFPIPTQYNLTAATLNDTGRLARPRPPLPHPVHRAFSEVKSGQRGRMPSEVDDMDRALTQRCDPGEQPSCMIVGPSYSLREFGQVIYRLSKRYPIS